MVSPNLSVSAVVLAAGQSARMGRDKALLEVDGVPLWQRQRDILTAAGAAEIFLSARPDQLWARAAKGFSAVIHDSMPGCGPIVGLTAALERSPHPLVAVVAVDLPAITSDWFRSMLGDSTSECGVVGRKGAYFEPLAAIYPRTIMWLAWAALAQHDYSLQRLVATGVEKGLLRVREIQESEVTSFTNWNREEDRGPGSGSGGD